MAPHARILPQNPQHSDRPQSSTSILIVEDEFLLAISERQMLEDMGYRVTGIAESYETAIQQTGETEPDLVLMDIRLQGGLDGVAAAEEIRRRYDIPVVYVTAHADHEQLKLTTPTEPFGYVVKPFQALELQAAIELGLYRHGLDRERNQLLEENRGLARMMLTLQEDERTALAQELHDELSQHLTAIEVYAETIAQTTAGVMSDVHDCAQAIGASASHLYRLSNHMMRRLRPEMLKEIGLVTALQNLLNDWQELHTNSRYRFQTAGAVNNCAEPVNIAVYRIVQECLTNVGKHAVASKVRIFIGLRPPPSDAGVPLVRLVVRDNGRGMDMERPSRGFGLIGMRERAESLGGHLVLKSRPEQGVRILVEIPSIISGN